MMEKSIADTLRDFAREFDPHLDCFLSIKGPPPELLEAMRYSALAPGKRIRPYIVVHCCELVGGKRDEAWAAAGALECIHAFSLVHDDLPALDNDDLRRGRPTTHKKFGEAMAVLAGDALLTLAFELIAQHTKDPLRANMMTLELARGAGWSGMIGGQAQDVLGEKLPAALDLVRSIHDRKTAKLFAAACRVGAIAGGAAEADVTALGRYGMLLGRAFQIADDLLDVTSDSHTLGKSAGKDVTAGKQTYPACVGVEASRVEMQGCIAAALAELQSFGGKADDLAHLARYAGSRKF